MLKIREKKGEKKKGGKKRGVSELVGRKVGEGWRG